MKITFVPLVVLSFAVILTSCSSGEQDGRKYYSSNAPAQSRMGVQFKRVPSDSPPPAAQADGTPAAAPAPTSDGSLFGSRLKNESPGLLDRNEKLDEPGAEYWIHGQQSADPVQGRMGVRVSRKKK